MGCKKSNCNQNAIQLDTKTCLIQITSSGRCVLPDDVHFATDVDGIQIFPNDVYLDCLDHTLKGDVVDNTLFPTGIFVQQGSSDITISNCHATKFGGGIVVDGATGNLIISDSSFNENQDVGGLLLSLPEIAITILSSHCDHNGGITSPFLGRGLEFQLEGTIAIASSTNCNGNLGTEERTDSFR